MQQAVFNGRYELLRLLGQGGMAKVYLAHDGLLGRDVALKVLREQYAEDEEFVERFEREARSVAALSHPNIVQIHDRGRSEDGRYYIVMEHVPGGTLKEYAKAEGPLEHKKAAEWAAQIAGALGAAHDRGVIHRDVKPQNVLLTESGRTKVADFGIARAASSASISRSSLVMGTPGYMSPEQATGEAATPGSDLYSLGVVLYEMLTGRVPFEAETPLAVSMKHANEPPRPPKELNPRVPKGMDALILKLLSKDPKDRHASAAELIEDLRRQQVADNAGAPGAVATGALATGALAGVARGEEPTLPIPGGAVAGPRKRRKAPLVVASLALLLALLGGGYLWQGLQGPGIAGFLKGVPGEARRVLEDVGRSVGTIGVAEAVNVPRVVGLSAEEAKERLEEAGFESELRPRESSEEDAGEILEQSVAGGKEAEKGSIILLAGGTGPPREEAPAPATEEPAAPASEPEPAPVPEPVVAEPASAPEQQYQEEPVPTAPEPEQPIPASEDPAQYEEPVAPVPGPTPPAPAAEQSAYEDPPQEDSDEESGDDGGDDDGDQYDDGDD